jgi:hypothetical protein
MPVFFKAILLYLDTKWSRSLIFGFLNALIHAVYGTNSDKPTLQQSKTFVDRNVFIRIKCAATTAKSIAGSSTLIPPVMF